MALKAPVFVIKIQQKPRNFSKSVSLPTTHIPRGRKTLIGCINDIEDAELSANFAAEAAKIKDPIAKRKEALEKSGQILFGELCKFCGLREAEMKRRWQVMGKEEKTALIEGFVANWGVGFHPLSLRSVKQLVDEHLDQGDQSTIPNFSFKFPDLKEFIRFNQEG